MAPGTKLYIRRRTHYYTSTGPPALLIKRPRHDDVDIENVRIWPGFTYKNVFNMCQSILETTIEHDMPKLSSTQTEISDERTVHYAMSSWCLKRKPIKAGATAVQQALGQRLKEASFRPWGPPLTDGVFTDGLYSDWTITRVDDPDAKTLLVIGDSKLSSKWLSAWLDRDAYLESESQSEERLWPLRQLATYCRLAGTRYGFIITPEELVALSMMSFRDKHRAIVPSGSALAINSWHPIDDERQPSGWKHHLTGEVVPRLPRHAKDLATVAARP